MEDLEMFKIPPTLKWLAEKRARVAGELGHRERRLQCVEAEVVGLRADLAALDKALFLYDRSVNAQSIEPISAWAGNYGTRGSLMEFLSSLVEASAPSPISTRELTQKTMERFTLVFETEILLTRWKHNSLLSALKRLVNAGKVELLPRAKVGHSGSWRWVEPKVLTLAELRASSALIAAEATANELADAEA
jgi:hypothetical protein